jgi:hypothetical protein
VPMDITLALCTTGKQSSSGSLALEFTEHAEIH